MDSLVSTGALADRLGEAGLIVLDASFHLRHAGRDARAEFEQSHISGARFLDLASLTDPWSPVPASLPTAEQFARRMGELGVVRSSRIVLYDDSALRSSARAWFICRMNGFDNVAILDGGLGKWRADNEPVEAGATEIDLSQPDTVCDNEKVRTLREMLANLESRAEQVLDARDAGRFTGEIEDRVHNLPGGHIPGAKNLPYTALFAQDGAYREPAELREAFARAGIDLARPVVTSCGSGMTAAVLLFAMHLLDKNDTALYDGSWSEWGADPDTPKETGPAH